MTSKWSFAVFSVLLCTTTSNSVHLCSLPQTPFISLAPRNARDLPNTLACGGSRMIISSLATSKKTSNSRRPS